MLDASASAPLERTVPVVPAGERRYVCRQFPSARHECYVNANAQARNEPIEDKDEKL